MPTLHSLFAPAVAVILVVGSAPSASAQISLYLGSSPNVTAVVDFDQPLIQSGPISSNNAAFLAAGIESIELGGGGFFANGTVVPPSLETGQALVSQNGVLSVAGPQEAMDDALAGDTFELCFPQLVDDLQLRFVHESNLFFTLELFSGGVSIGSRDVNWTFGAGLRHYWRGPAAFDRAVIRMRNAIPWGVGLDEMGAGVGPLPQPPVNDECTGVLPAPIGETPFDTTFATPSPEPWPCSGGGRDVWFEHVAAADANLRFDAGNSSFAVRMGVYTGTCGNLTPLTCGPSSGDVEDGLCIEGAIEGERYWIRLGSPAFNPIHGAGVLRIFETDPLPPITDQCVETFFAPDVVHGETGGPTYFDLDLTRAVTIEGLSLIAHGISCDSMRMEMWVIQGTYIGNTNDPAGWILAGIDNGRGVGQGFGNRSYVKFESPVHLQPGSYGVAVRNFGLLSGVSIANGTNEVHSSPDGVLTLTGGAIGEAMFSGILSDDRIWNGAICYDLAPIGDNYCGPAVVNSSGAVGRMVAFGSRMVVENDLTLRAEDLPASSFGLFIVSQTSGFVVMPGGSEGNLCLAGMVGRYVGPGEVQISGASQSFDLAIDLSLVPQPTGFVPVAAGQSWNFQAWFRDSVGGVPTSNFTDGLTLSFL